jgi:polynucleotide 5'-hydroxyl-kinase GRC3/NOL9
MRVVYGSIDILGTTLLASPTTHPIFAPKSHPVPVITAQAHSSDPSQVTLPAEVARSCDKSDTVVYLQPLRSGIEGMGDVCGIFGGIFNLQNTSGPQLNIEGLYLVSFFLIHGVSRAT